MAIRYIRAVKNQKPHCMNIRSITYLIVGLSVLIGCSSAPQKEWDYKIAYNVLYDGYVDDYEIFIMNPDGSGQVNISNNPGVDWVYHAYEDKLYFISDRDSTKRKYFLYEMNWDGTEVRKVTDFLVHDSWFNSRNNGKELLVVPNFGEEAPRDIFIIDLEGNVLDRLTDDEHHNNDPAFSPDGKQIAFRSYRTGLDELFIMNADGSNLRQVTTYPEDDTTSLDWEYHAGPPQWADSTTLSYVSKKKNNYSIFTVDINTLEVSQITPDTTDRGNFTNEGWHSWSKDGNNLVFNSTDWKGNYDIYSMDKDGNGIERLMETEWYEQAPLFVYPTKLVNGE